MRRFTRITKQEAQKRFAASLPIYLNPCKLAPNGPWSMACLVFGKDYESWDQMYNNWAFYNATYETGYYAHYYVEASAS